MEAFISEVSYAENTATDFVEIAVEEGTDISDYSVVIYTSAGMAGQILSVGTLANTMAGHDVYVVDNTTTGFGQITERSAVALMDGDGNVIQFISFGDDTVTANNGPAAGHTSQAIGTAHGDESLQTDDGGETYYTQSSPNEGTIPCYAPGTMIDTPDGPRAVETLEPGDLVMTLDHGAQPVAWTRAGDHPLDGLPDDARPVLIQAGALGPGNPVRDLIVSPQHRIMIGGFGQLRDLYQTETFVPAKALTTLPRIRFMMGRRNITWIHFACPKHEVVCANGSYSESLLLGPMVTAGLTPAERQHLHRLFGRAGPGQALNGDPARPCLTVGQTKRLLNQPQQPDRIAA